MPAKCRISGIVIPASCGVQGTGREKNPFRAHGFHLGGRYLVIPAHLDLGTQFAQILDQVIGKRIVVVEDENHKLNRQVSSLYQSCADAPGVARGWKSINHKGHEGTRSKIRNYNPS